jgi:hypothetical protein
MLLESHVFCRNHAENCSGLRVVIVNYSGRIGLYYYPIVEDLVGVHMRLVVMAKDEKNSCEVQEGNDHHWGHYSMALKSDPLMYDIE